LSALLLVAGPASADSEYAGVQTAIDWRLVVVLVVLGLFAFFAVLQRLNRDR